MRQLFLDTETTGLEPAQGHRIAEIGAVEYVARQPSGREFHSYLNPEREVDPGSYSVHGLDRDFLAEHPRFSEVVESLLDFVRDAQVIMHNAPFDLGFLNAEIERCNQSRTTPLPDFHQVCRVEDSLQLARNKYGGRNDLDSLCERLNIENTNRQLHSALVDAKLLARVYIAMTSSQGDLDLDMGAGKAAPARLNREDLDFLRVVKASDEEVAAHRAYMQALVNPSK